MAKKTAPVELVKEATDAVELLIASWRGIKENYLLFGRACTLLEDKGLYAYVRKTSKQPFLSFDELLDAKTGGDCSRTTVFEAKRIYKLTLGPVAVSDEKLKRMPRKNQLKLAQVVRETENLPAEERRELIEKVSEKAVTETVNEFAVTAQSAINDQLPSEKQKSPLVRMSLMLDPRAAEEFKNLIEDFKLTPVVRDGIKELDMTSKAIRSICHAARNYAREYLTGARKKAEENAPIIPATEPEADSAEKAAPAIAEAYSAPDAAQTIANAETERRSIKRSETSLFN